MLSRFILGLALLVFLVGFAAFTGLMVTKGFYKLQNEAYYARHSTFVYELRQDKMTPPLYYALHMFKCCIYGVWIAVLYTHDLNFVKLTGLLLGQVAVSIFYPFAVDHLQHLRKGLGQEVPIYDEHVQRSLPGHWSYYSVFRERKHN